ncbi:hypothetical protein Godav_002898, partial [Gossypium davidsonii]|nr:hypothetical protein [Gossypium davidsonii]
MNELYLFLSPECCKNMEKQKKN